MKEGIKLITKLGPSRPLPDPISVAHISGPVHHGGSCQFSSSGKNGTNPRNPSQNSQRGRAASIPIYSRHTRWAIEPKATNLRWRSLVNQAPEKKNREETHNLVARSQRSRRRIPLEKPINNKLQVPST